MSTDDRSNSLDQHVVELLERIDQRLEGIEKLSQQAFEIGQAQYMNVTTEKITRAITSGRRTKSN